VLPLPKQALLLHLQRGQPLEAFKIRTVSSQTYTVAMTRSSRVLKREVTGT